MKILYFHQYFTTPAEAGGVRSYWIAKHLAQKGHEVHIITSDRRFPPRFKGWRTTHLDGFWVHWLPVPYSNHMSFQRRIRAFLHFSVAAALKARKIPADVVFATSTPLTIALPAIYVARQQHIPMVFEVRDLWPEVPVAYGAIRGPLVPLAYWLERFAYRHSSSVIALSPDMKAGVERTGYPSSKIAVIPNMADIETFRISAEKGQTFRKKFPWLQERPLVVYIGTIGHVNGVDYLVRLAAKVWNLAPEVRFLVVGDGARREDVRTLAQHLDVWKRNFFMLPPIPKQDIPMVLSAADVATSLFINLKALWANSANKFFDALASGTPIAINYLGWQADLLRRSGAGIVLPAEDVKAAAQDLTQFLRDAKRLQKASNAASQLALQFSRQNLVQEVEKVLMETYQDRR